MPQSTPFPVSPEEVPIPGTASQTQRADLYSKLGHGKSAAPPFVWPHLLVLFIGLVGLKLWLIGGLGESLYEIHWRIGGLRVSWVNYAAFYGFVLLGTLALARLGKCCRSAGNSNARAINAVVLVLGLAFIFLTFHNGNRNYLYPILDGTLNWGSLAPYLANALFFNKPFLAAWFFAYTLGYYLLARSGREAWVLFLATFLGAAYCVFNLQDLLVYRNELLIADCFGLVSIFLAWRSKRNLRLLWLLLPVAWTLFFVVALLRFDTQWQTHSANYFLGLAVLALVLFSAATWLINRLGNAVPWNTLVPFFFISFFVLTNANYPSSENYSHLLCLALTLPRYFAGELALVAVLALGAVIYRKLRPNAGLWWVDVLGIGLLTVAGLDLRLSQIMGVRLGWDLLSFGDSPKMMWRMARPYVPGALAGLALVVLVYTVALRVLRTCQARSPTESVVKSHGSGFAYIAFAFISMAILGLAIAQSDKAEAQAGLRFVQTSPLWKRVATRLMTRDEFLRTAQSLGLVDLASPRAPAGGQKPRDLNVLMVFMESSYNKHLSLFGSSEETQPLLSNYRDRMELFPNFFSAFTGSIHARFATFTSLYPVLDFDTFTQQRVPVKSLFEVLHDHGYTCSMFYSSYFGYTGFGDFLKNRGLDEMHDAGSMPGQRKTERVEWGLLEEETLGAMRDQIKKYAQGQQRFFLTYVPAAPHYPYDCIPKPFRKHKMQQVGDFSPLYLNELLYMDWILASILEQLKESNLLDQTLVVITNDHGEMLGGADGQLGHGWKVTPELANTPLIVMDPGVKGFQLNTTIGSQVDLLPTLLDRLGIAVPADQLYEGQSLYAASNRSRRRIYLNSYKQYAVVSDNQIMTGDREVDSLNSNIPGASAFTIQNHGTKTLFIPEPTNLSIPTIQPFDTFQESLLRNYAFYRAAVLRPD
jgi:hypothetical protein